jgi:drug/metabolite transporter (DMT)-like permease
MIPCIATVISIIVGVEDFTWYKFVGILMAVAGAITVEVWKPEEQASVSAEPSAPDDKQHHYNDNRGVLVTIVQVTACATYLVYQKRILNKYPSTLVTLIYYSIGGSFTGLCVGVYALFGGVSIADMGLQYEAKVWLGVVYVVLFSTLYAWNAYTYASKYLAPSTSTIFMSLQPIFTASLIFMCYDTLLTAPQYVGGFLVVLGMVLTVLSSQYMPEAGGGGGWKLETLQSSYTPLAHSEGGGDQSYGIL